MNPTIKEVKYGNFEAGLATINSEIINDIKKSIKQSESITSFLFYTLYIACAIKRISERTRGKIKEVVCASKSFFLVNSNKTVD